MTEKPLKMLIAEKVRLVTYSERQKVGIEAKTESGEYVAIALTPAQCLAIASEIHDLEAQSWGSFGRPH